MSCEHPVDVVRRIVSDSIGEPEFVHSTSWRQSDPGVILTFVVVVDAGLWRRDGHRVRPAK